MSPPILRALPAEDDTFGRAFEEAAAASADAGEAQRRLREQYPLATVVVREPDPEHPLDGARWDAYRYASSVPAERWWGSPDLPWAVLDDDRVFVDASPEVATIVEAPLEAILGQTVDGFASGDDPTIQPDLAGIWALFLATGELDGTLRFRRLDGSARELDYHLVANGRGPGRHLAIVRERPDEVPA